MKHKLFHLQSLVTVALFAIIAIAFTSCSDDDDEPAIDELTSIMVGAWAQDGDNDIFVVKANGTGVGYENRFLKTKSYGKGTIVKHLMVMVTTKMLLATMNFGLGKD